MAATMPDQQHAVRAARAELWLQQALLELRSAIGYIEAGDLEALRRWKQGGAAIALDHGVRVLAQADAAQEQWRADMQAMAAEIEREKEAMLASEAAVAQK